MNMANKYLLTLVMWAICMLSAAALIKLTLTVKTDRARECSELLHTHQMGESMPNGVSVEIGACLLEFNQLITGGSNGD